ncbi:hypothetical protein DVDV_1346 [Desulfovibrio sp. DV]|nr:hypothetical protein DVDV_1346 [Desulfovibrio sp. DV]
MVCRSLPALRQLLWPEGEEGLTGCQETDRVYLKSDFPSLQSRLRLLSVTLRL